MTKVFIRVLQTRLPNFPLARCRGVNPEIFHSDDREWDPNPHAKALCNSCAHTSQCLVWALDHNESGTWGGMTLLQRKALRRRRHRVQCLHCSGYDIVSEGRAEICVSCGMSWLV